MPFDHAQYYANTNWQASAEQFEQRLGAYAFRHPRALAAARKTVNRLKQLLIKYSRIEHKDSALANKSFFKDDRTSAGQVGEKMTTTQINDFFSRDGNVRELITAVYNAAYYNKGAELSLKNILNSIIGPRPQLASTLGMNEEELKKHSAFLNSWTRLPLWAGASAVGKGYNYEKDPYALGGLLWQSDSETIAGDTREMISSQGPRKERSEAGKLANRKTPVTTRPAAPRSARASWSSRESRGPTTSCPGTRARPTGRSSRTRHGRRRTPSEASRSSPACPAPRPGCSKPSSGSTCPGWTSSTTGWR